MGPALLLIFGLGVLVLIMFLPLNGRDPQDFDW